MSSLAIDNYIKDNGNHCIKCGSNDVESNELSFNSSGVAQDKSCLTCGEKWQDDYSLTGVSELD